MFLTLSAWIYITFLCWTWGILFLQLTKRTTGSGPLFPHFSIICLTGLAMITIVAGTLSLFIPLGQWWVQFFFIVPAVAASFIKNIPYFFSSLKKELFFLPVSLLILLSSLLLLILVMGSWTIVHPDTLGYHAQTIQWIEKYKAVPGLVNLHVRFGYQGLWFVDCALFDFSFTGKQGITYLNSTVLFWFLLFIVNRIHHNFLDEGKNLFGLCWTGLLLLSLWSYTQIRLTATSASPDFVAVIIVLTVFYLLLEKRSKHLDAGEWSLTGSLSLLAVTIKLSTAPILLVALAAVSLFIIGRKIRSLIFLVFIGLVVFSAFVSRNIITSGYVIFPSVAPDIVNADWKYSKELTAKEQNYITAYARKQGVVTKEEIDLVNEMSASEWLPGWWKNRSSADKTIMILFLVSLIGSLIFLKQIVLAGFPMLLSLVTTVVGITFWFMNAPDPRFGFGFILGFIGVVFFLVLEGKKPSISRYMLKPLLVVATLATLGYTAYRFMKFFVPAQLIAPLGVPPSPYKTFECGGVKINSPVNAEFGSTPVPCTDQDCGDFYPRGDKVEDGFRTKENL